MKVLLDMSPETDVYAHLTQKRDEILSSHLTVLALRF
jgi:hypothetical protein